MTDNRTEALTRVVVGVDGSDQSKSALRWAVLIAKMTGARVIAVAVWHLPANYGMVYVPGDWQPGQDAESGLSLTLAAVFGDERPMNLDVLVVEGNPAKVLLDQSVDAQLLVVGSRGHGGFAGLLLGSVSSICAEHASCPVLVVHGDGPPL